MKRAYLVIELLVGAAIAIFAVAASFKILSAVSTDIHSVFINVALAAWVQAIGSIMAILGAFAISARQARRDARQRWNDKIAERIERVEDVKMIFINCIPAMKTLEGWAVETMPTEFPQTAVAMINRGVHELGYIRMTDLPTVQLAIYTSTIQIHIEALLEAVKRIDFSRTMRGPVSEEDKDAPRRAICAVDVLLNAADRVIADLETRLR